MCNQKELNRKWLQFSDKYGCRVTKDLAIESLNEVKNPALRPDENKTNKGLTNE